MKFYIQIKFLLVFALFPFSLFSQELSMSSLFIPKALKENANAVVRLNEKTITLDDFDHITIQEKTIITVLNKLGDRHIDLFKHYDNDKKITKLSARSFDAFGNQTKKYSKNKFDDYSAANGLYTDNRVKHLNYTPNKYPYTIVFEYETKSKSTAFIDPWYPINGYSISVEKSIYKIINDKKLTIRSKEKNFEGFSIENKSKDGNIHFELKNQKAIKHESHSPSFSDILPNMLVSLNKFSLNGYDANASNWQEFGKWMKTDLYDSRLSLSEETKLKAKDLVKNENDPIEKAKIIYRYVQNKTRYILVAIGIGGWQPSKAEDVDKLGYGDCKGLTNYTKALLDVVGVQSNWTVVYAKNKKNIDKDFTSMQGNHMMLNIPNEANDIWLECTSQTIPFGFLGRFTDDRDVLVLTDKGGVIKHTAIYKNETNSQQTEAKIILDTNGRINATVNITSKGIQYGDRYRIIDDTKEEIDTYYKNTFWDYINNLTIETYDFNNNKDEVVFKEDLKIFATNYASLLDKEMLFSPNIFNKYTRLPTRYRNRVQPLKIGTGFKDIDNFEIQIPETYKINQLPDKTIIDNEFGHYECSVKKTTPTTLQYNRIFQLNEGLHPKESYSKYREFIKSIIKKDNTKIALSKK